MTSFFYMYSNLFSGVTEVFNDSFFSQLASHQYKNRQLHFNDLLANEHEFFYYLITVDHYNQNAAICLKEIDYYYWSFVKDM